MMTIKNRTQIAKLTTNLDIAAIAQLVSNAQFAIAYGQWKVDGAADPDKALDTLNRFLLDPAVNRDQAQAATASLINTVDAAFNRGEFDEHSEYGRRTCVLIAQSFQSAIAMNDNNYVPLAA